MEKVFIAGPLSTENGIVKVVVGEHIFEATAVKPGVLMVGFKYWQQPV